MHASLPETMATLPTLEPNSQAVSPPGSDELVVIQFNSWSELERYRPDWDQLLSRSKSASIFMTPEWLSCWWRAYGAGRQLCSLAFVDTQNRTVALAPLYLDHSSHAGVSATTLRLIGAGSGDSDDLDFIVEPGHEMATARAFADWFQSNGNCHIGALETLPANSLVAKSIVEAAHSRGWRLSTEILPHSYVELPRTWTGYLETLASEFRPLLTRYPRRLQSRFSVDISRCENVDELDARLQTLFTLHQMRWTGRGETGAFASPQRRDFYSRMALAFLQRGWLEFWSLTLEKEVVATQFCFRHGDTVSLLQEGFNPRYTAEKVGYALRAHVLQEMIATGARRYDFLGGADAYKAKFGATQGQYLNLYFAGPSWKGRLLLAARGINRAIKGWLKTHLPQSILAALQRGPSHRPANG